MTTNSPHPYTQVEVRNITRKIADLNTKIDSLTALLLATESKFELRTFMKSVYKTLKNEGVTTLMTISQTPGSGFGVEGFVADSVLLLENVVDKDQFKTRLIILKMRGTEHSKRYHSVTLSPKMGVSKY